MFGSQAGQIQQTRPVRSGILREAGHAFRSELDSAVYATALLVVLLHMINASAFHTSGSILVRFIYMAAATLVVALGLFVYSGAGTGRRIALALAYGLPSLIVGIGIHAYHAAELGVQGSDVTGLLMLVAGVALTLLMFVKAFRRLHPWPWRLVLLPAAYVLAIYVVVPISFGVAAANVARLPNDVTPAAHGLAYEDVSFKTANGTLIRAWYIPSKNGAAVIAVHGASGNRSKIVDHAVVLARHGYGVLMIDVEGFGESEGRSNNFGWYGARDVAAAVDYLKTRDDVDPERIGGLGLSMGGEILLTAAASVPNLRAVVAEGASGRTWQDYKDQPGRDWLAAPTYFLAVFTADVLSRASEPRPLLKLVSEIKPKPLLLISADVKGEREMNRLFVELGGTTAELWEIPEAEHTGALELYPDEYEQRVLSFFDGALAAR